MNARRNVQAHCCNATPSPACYILWLIIAALIPSCQIQMPKIPGTAGPQRDVARHVPQPRSAPSVRTPARAAARPEPTPGPSIPDAASQGGAQ